MIIPVTANGSEIFDVVAKIDPTIKNEDPHLVMMACLCITVILMKPDIEPDNLSAAVKGMSEWASLYLDSLNPEESDVKKMN